MKTAEEYVKELEFCSLSEDIEASFKSYALQEVKKHLKIAAEEAMIKIDTGENSMEVDEQSITGIKIELT